MKYKENRKVEPIYEKITKSGICSLCGEYAEVTSMFRGSIEHRNDLQGTYRFKGYKCSMEVKNRHQNPMCLDLCLLIQKEF